MSPATSRDSLGWSKTGTQGSALSVSLSTSRMKFLEGCNMDTSPEEDAGKDSSSMEGKGSVEGVPFPCPLTSPSTCQVQPCALQVTLLFPAHPQARGLCVWVLAPVRILRAQGKSGSPSAWVGPPTLACLSPCGPLISRPGACPEALDRQREAAGRLLEVLEDLDRAHEDFQWQERGTVAPGPLGP